MERDLEKVQELYSAWQRSDLKRMLLCIPEEFQIFQSGELPWGGEYVGHVGFRRFTEGMTSRLEFRIEIQTFIDAGEHIIAFGAIVGNAKDTALEFDIPVFHVWTFRAGSPIRLEAYLDNPTMLAALRT